MSNDSLSVSPSPEADHEAAPLAWLLALLREAMVGVMADDTPALKKANALARLGSLYLKTFGAAELRRANAELVERVPELEERPVPAEGERILTAKEAAGQTVSESEGSKTVHKTRTAKRPKSHSDGKHRPAQRPKGRSSPRQKQATR
jgi:hypothetical protein